MTPEPRPHHELIAQIDGALSGAQGSTVTKTYREIAKARHNLRALAAQRAIHDLRAALEAAEKDDDLAAAVARAETAEKERDEAIAHRRKHYVSRSSSLEDPVGHDGLECDKGCDACYFVREWDAAVARQEQLEQALGWLLVGSIENDSGVRVSSEAFVNARKVLKGGEAVASPVAEKRRDV